MLYDKIYIYYTFHAIILIHARVGKYCDYAKEPTKQCYVKEILATLPHSPNQLAVDKTTNSLYFSFDYGQGDYIPALLDLETKKIRVLKGVKDAFAIANDAVNNEMYFGGSYGIYRYKPRNRTLKRLNVSNLDIWWLYVNKNIYFIKFPSLNGYFYEKRSIITMRGLKNISVHQFVFDQDGNVFFINSTGLYGIRKDEDIAVLLGDNLRFVGIASDNNGYVYVCSDDGVFIVRKIVQKIRKLINVQGVLGMAFDKANNFIYSDSHELVRLLPMYDSPNTVD
ncbi:hypothetical protein K1T71_009533 [Dendrolimus kikuchii]|uniref:Uncharacterized protein n=1 Tax=Dendrolimus kikuchii TaxID=765133 RepID=A0ACC1CSM7_9NEOP|nr:hypothetical protein K1T71_009533 [Dendrolimus kikuchii]